MQFMRTDSAQGIDIGSLLPGLMSMSILFGTTSMLAVTITFERRGAPSTVGAPGCTKAADHVNAIFIGLVVK